MILNSKFLKSLLLGLLVLGVLLENAEAHRHHAGHNSHGKHHHGHHHHHHHQHHIEADTSSVHDTGSSTKTETGSFSSLSSVLSWPVNAVKFIGAKISGFVHGLPDREHFREMHGHPQETSSEAHPTSTKSSALLQISDRRKSKTVKAEVEEGVDATEASNSTKTVAESKQKASVETSAKANSEKKKKKGSKVQAEKAAVKKTKVSDDDQDDDDDDGDEEPKTWAAPKAPIQVQDQADEDPKIKVQGKADEDPKIKVQRKAKAPHKKKAAALRDQAAVNAAAAPAPDAADAAAAPAPGAAAVPGEPQIDIDANRLPYNGLDAFGREDTAQELTEASIGQTNAMVDQLEKAEEAEERRAVFRALTRLRGAAIASFDGIAKSHLGNVNEYAAQNHWRSQHPIKTLAEEESDVSQWAFPQQAD
eukprot:TRINITY_DN113_c0_g1_i1.p1 TRINITY_DN113_c0_g1~~TRINITY_DN113_c0_g1_i1.p1  ORF type:complete len:420 (+),score=116.10 TRINITY_DN113_c0_g1_i1:100-1359(+)